MALDAKLLKQVDLSSAFPIMRDKWQGGKVTNDLLGAYASEMASDTALVISASEIADLLLGAQLKELVNNGIHWTGHSEEELLRDAGLSMMDQKESYNVRSELEVPETLGAWDIVTGMVGLVKKEEALRCALIDWLEDDRTFAIKDTDDQLYNAMRPRIGSSIDFVVTGHTHLARAMSYGDGPHYFNCGTWIRTLRLTKQVLADERIFNERLWPVLKKGQMADLEIDIPGENGNVTLLLDKTNAVRIRVDGNEVVGDLLKVTDDKFNSGVKLERELGTTSLRR